MPKFFDKGVEKGGVAPSSTQRKTWVRRNVPEQESWEEVTEAAHDAYGVQPLTYSAKIPLPEPEVVPLASSGGKALASAATPPPNNNESGAEAIVPPTHQVSRSMGWVRRRGHALTCVLLFFFTLLVYTRPNDWWSPKWAFYTLTITLTFYVGAATLGLFLPIQIITDGTLTARPRELWYVLTLLVMGAMSIPLATYDRWYARFTFEEMFVRAILIFIVMINVLRTERRWRMLLTLTWGVGVWLAYDAFSKYLSGDFTIEGYRITGAIGGMFGNPNDLSQHLVTMMPLTVAFLLSVPRNAADLTKGSGAPSPGVISLLLVLIPRILRRAFYGVCLVMILLGTMVTFSRSGFLATFTSSLVMTWKFGRKYRAFLMCCVIVGAVGVLAAAPGQYRSRVISIFDDEYEVAKGSAASRKFLLTESIKVSLRHPFLGIGMGNFRVIYDLQTHNAYTQVSSEIGLIGFAAYLLFLLAPLKRLHEIEKATVNTPDHRRFYYLSVGLQAALVAYLVGSFFGAIAYFYNVYYLVGFAVAFRMIYYNAIGISVNTLKLPDPDAPVAAKKNVRPDWDSGWAQGSTG